MVEVTEFENFWDKRSWEAVKSKYYDPLIESGDISQFVWDVEDNDYYYRVRRSYWDLRDERWNAERTAEVEPGPEQLPPHIKVSYTVEMETDDPAEALEIVQNHDVYWPGVDLKTYGIAATVDEPVSVCMVLRNFDEDEEEAPQGNIQYE